jgi:GT2 family glycosyltransferase
MSGKRSVSILIPVYNEEEYIANCLDSILLQDYSKENLKIYIIDGLSTDSTRSIVNSYCSRFPYIYMLDNPDRIIPCALNIGIKEAYANCEYIVRLDAHSRFPSDYINQLILYSEKLEAANVGGVIHTLPADSSQKAKSISVALSHPFGMGNSLFRIGVKKITEVDTVPFGCFKKEIFNLIGLFDTELKRNEDDEFNGRIIKNGGKIYLIPDIIIDYYARGKYRDVSKMFYQYGLYKPMVNKKLGGPATLRQFAPLLLVLGLFLGFAISLLDKYLFYIYIFFISLYFFICVTIGIIQSIKSKTIKLLFLMPVVFSIIHFSYGVGYLQGLAILKNK